MSYPIRCETSKYYCKLFSKVTYQQNMNEHWNRTVFPQTWSLESHLISLNFVSKDFLVIFKSGLKLQFLRFSEGLLKSFLGHWMCFQSSPSHTACYWNICVKDKKVLQREWSIRQNPAAGLLSPPYRTITPGDASPEQLRYQRTRPVPATNCPNFCNSQKVLHHPG